jgi:hypothetical protein
MGIFYICKVHGQIIIKTYIFNPFLTLHACDSLLQIENLFQLTIELLISASISQYYDNFGCYPPLIIQFIKKIFFKYL